MGMPVPEPAWHLPEAAPLETAGLRRFSVIQPDQNSDETDRRTVRGAPGEMYPG